MLHLLKNKIREIVPDKVLVGYHYFLSAAADKFHGNPSDKMYVIGVTGTKGKTSTANFIWSVLQASGMKTGLIGTANIRIGDKEFLNEYHMTMPGPFVIQRLLKQMAAEGCRHVVLEVTSEGIKLARNNGIIFDCAIFTNLTPEHLPSHGGSFENYKQTKGKLFASLMEHAKQLNAKYVKRVIIGNADDPNKDFFLNFPADLKIKYGLNQGSDVQAENIQERSNGVDFTVKNKFYHISTLGKFNVYNALAAMSLAQALELNEDNVRKGLANLKLIPGRMELIDEGQNFTTIVDYAHEKVSMNAVLDAARRISKGKVIVLLGAEGGGRDKSKRKDMGEAAGLKADYVVISNVDPYDDNPQEIIHEIADASVATGKVIGQNLFREPDRRKGIAKALSLASAGDIVILTGKGAEQSMIIGGKNIPWDDRKVVREELNKLPK